MTISDKVFDISIKLYACNDATMSDANLIRTEVAALERERDALRAEVERLCVHGAEPTSEEWAALRKERDTFKADRAHFIEVNQLLRNRPDLGDRASRVDALIQERDALKAQRDGLHYRLYPQPCKGCPGCSSYADCPDEIHRLTTERDALKAKLAALVEAVSPRFDVTKKTSPSIRDAQRREILVAIASAKETP